MAFLLLLLSPRHAGATPPDLAWVPPSELRLVELSHPTPSATLEEVTNLAEAIPIGKGEALLVPSAGGELVRLEGDELEVGFGTGIGPTPDAVVWPPANDPGRVREIRVPTWGMTQCVVVRGRDHRPVTAVVRVAARRADPMRWFRTDQEIAAWLRDPTAPTPTLANPLEDAQSIVDFLAAARDSFEAAAGLPAVRWLLLERWLADSARFRPLDAPFFASGVPQVTGGTVPPPSSLRPVGPRAAQRIVETGRSLLIDANGLDVITFQLETRADRGSVVRIRQGEALVAELRTDVPQLARDRARFTAPRGVRAVPSQGRVRLEVAVGTVRVTVRGYAQRNSAGAPSLRERKRLLRRAAAAEQTSGASSNTLRVVAALANAEANQTRNAVTDVLALAADPGVPAGMRALLVHDAIRNGLELSTLGERLGKLAAATSGLPATQSGPLRRSALEFVARATTTVPDDLRPRDLSGFLAGSVEPSEAEEIRLLVELLLPPRDRARSLTTARAEERAARSARSPNVTNLADLAWRRIAPWSNLKAGDKSPTVQRFAAVFAEPDSNGRCSWNGAAGLRWLALGEDAEVDVSERGGTHTQVALVGDPSEPPHDSLVEIEGQPMAVHGGANLGSRIAVRPGRRLFSLRSGAGVLAKIPSEGEIDCERLRDEVTWVVVRGTAAFPLPGGPALTVANVLVSPETLTGPSEVEIEVGATTYRGWVHPPATGGLEVPIPPDATLMRVRASQPLMVRVLMRMHRWPEPPPPKAAPSTVTPPAEAELIEQIRQATRALRRATGAPGRIAAWRDRARALEALTFLRYAAADRGRLLAAGGEPDPAPAALGAPLAIDLLPGSGDVEPLGSLPLIPPLPQPKNPAPLRDVLNARDRGVEPRILLEKLAPSAERSNAVDALLLAVLAEDLGESSLAAHAYERIGRAHDSPRALALASGLNADAAVANDDLKATLDAYVLAREVAERDPRAAGVLARLQDSMDWEAVGADETAGTALVEAYRYTDPETAPLGVRVRSALLDGPSYAVLSFGDPITTTVRAGSSYRVDALCHAVEGPHEGCPVRLELDGKPTRCRTLEDDGVSSPAGEDQPSPPLEIGLVGSDRTIAHEHSCWVEAPEMDGRLVVTPPSDREVLAWVAVRRFTEQGLEPVTIVGRWSEATREMPFRILVRGPTVLRVSVRGESGILQNLEREIAIANAAGEAATIPLDQRSDDYAWRRPGREPVGVASTNYVVLTEPGLHSVTLAPDRGRAFLRVEVARARRTPRPRASAAKDSVTPPLAGTNGGLPPVVIPAVGWDPELGMLTLGAEASFVVADLSEGDRDPQSDYFQLTLAARRSFDALPTSLRFALLGRARHGPETMGTEARIGFRRTAWTPAAFAFGRLLAQRFPSVTAAGFYGLVGVSHAERLARDLNLVSLGSAALRVVDRRAADLDEVDPGIYAPYSAAHPTSLDLQVRLEERPFVDLRGRVGSIARFLPEKRTLDRVEGFVQGTLLGGNGLAPEIDLELSASIRPTTVARDEAFIRYVAASSVGFSAWASDSSYLALLGSLTFFADAPPTNARGSGVAGMIGLSYDHVSRRGVRDLDAGARSFPDRREEGHAPPNRIPPRGHPFWEPSR
ncbi:MAG: hypothetical protein JW751_16705 [Polyangiaceae bacterium]|nr:hypothetical protein [Polyangiaceae bacterium]